MTWRKADLVVVGAGTVGGWAAYFAKTSGAERVIVVERGLVGQGASSRAAGVVRAQGGTPWGVRLGLWSLDFYGRQQSLLGTDSGLRRAGYIILATTKREVAVAAKRIQMQRRHGLEVRWLDRDEVSALNPTIDPAGHLGGTYTDFEGYIDPPRNVLAYSLAMRQEGVELLERTAFLGLETRSAGNARQVTGVRTEAGLIETERVVLTGGPALRSVGRLAGGRILAGQVRHQVVVTAPHPDFAAGDLPMGFDVRAGIYWRPEEEGLLWGMSNPQEAPGPAREFDWNLYRRMRRRLNRLVPSTQGLGLRKAWAATIDYTSDHLPILGPLVSPAAEIIHGTTVAAAAGHGMMWGPAVARAAADLALYGQTGVVDDVTELGMDRFDAQGRSRLASDPIALPFPVRPGDDEDRPAA